MTTHVNPIAEDPVTRETTCSRCGDCCDPVIMTGDPQQLAAELLAKRRINARNRADAEFMRDHWKTADTYVDEYGGRVYEVRCDMFDTKRRLCTAHDARPPVCQDYPWYGMTPEERIDSESAYGMSPRCSYTADVRTMLPIVTINGVHNSTE